MKCQASYRVFYLMPQTKTSEGDVIFNFGTSFRHMKTKDSIKLFLVGITFGMKFECMAVLLNGRNVSLNCLGYARTR